LTALYHGQRVRVVRLNGKYSVIIWHGALKRVHANELEVCDDH
jgi:hypothetical protein